MEKMVSMKVSLPLWVSMRCGCGFWDTNEITLNWSTRQDLMTLLGNLNRCINSFNSIKYKIWWKLLILAHIFIRKIVQKLAIMFTKNVLILWIALETKLGAFYNPVSNNFFEYDRTYLRFPSPNIDDLDSGCSFYEWWSHLYPLR